MILNPGDHARVIGHGWCHGYRIGDIITVERVVLDPLTNTVVQYNCIDNTNYCRQTLHPNWLEPLTTELGNIYINEETL